VPFTSRQRALFQAIAHGWRPPASSGIDMSQGTAKKLETEAAALPTRAPVDTRARKAGEILRRSS
jgi:hypothetical protein